jgi:hypothetical protein
MLIERIGKENLRIQFSSRISKENLDRIEHCVRYLEEGAIQRHADSFAEQVNKSWWGKNKHRFNR